MAERATIARPYARAAFAYACKGNALAAWSDALNGAAAVVGDVRVRKLIGNPKISATQLLDFIADILGGKLGNFFFLGSHCYAIGDWVCYPKWPPCSKQCEPRKKKLPTCKSRLRLLSMTRSVNA